MGDIAPERRKLVTTHDALGYFADRYGIDVIGAVIPSLSTRGQPSAGETARLAETMKRERVRVLFAEEGLDADVEAAIARETGAALGAPLYADTLGPAGSAGASYLSSTAANARALADGFTGRRGACAIQG
jgi:ABC-type Zn uptake system ZnuABC Zn-binding protein ZnuA